MTKKKFKEYILKLIELQIASEELNNVMKKFSDDFFSPFNRYEDLIVNLLEEVMNDKEGQWISYWLYELDYGKLARKNSVSIDNKNIPIKTIDDLYNLLQKVND